MLHALLGHYARVLWDVQKVRVGMGNRVGAMERDGLPPEFAAVALAARDDLKATEAAINRHLEKLARRHFLAPWIAEQPGIGLPGFARILGIAGPLDRFATVSKLWKYLGVHVTPEGRSARREKGARLDYSPQGRVVCHQIGESIVKVNRGPYREAYDRKKAEYLARERVGPSGCPFGQAHKDKAGRVYACGLAHADEAARRYAVKCLLRDMWAAWRRLREVPS